MGSRTVKLLAVILGLTGLAVFCFLINGARDKQVSVIKRQEEFIRLQTETPYDAIYQYYKALEGDNWDLVKSLTTEDLWEYIETSGFRKNWEKRTAEDPTLKFVLFIVKKQSIDEDSGEGWVMGKVDWTSQEQNVPDDNRTVYVVEENDSWFISKVISLPAVEVVDDFYEAVNAGNLTRAQELTTEDYWGKLVAAGVIQGIRKERSRFFGGVYVFFLVNDFSEKAKEAWVSGDVSFKPLTVHQKEVPVDVHVVKKSGQWKIDKIVGHWNIEK